GSRDYRQTKRVSGSSFRPVLGPWRDERDGILAETRAQPVDERYRHGGFIARKQAEIAARERGGDFACEHEPSPRRRQRDAGKPFTQHCQEMRRLTRRSCQREAGRCCRDTGFDADIAFVRERERHLENAEAAPGEPSRELVDETVRRKRERLDVRDWRRQVETS